MIEDRAVRYSERLVIFLLAVVFDEVNVPGLQLTHEARMSLIDAR